MNLLVKSVLLELFVALFFCGQSPKKQRNEKRKQKLSVQVQKWLSSLEKHDVLEQMGGFWQTAVTVCGIKTDWITSSSLGRRAPVLSDHCRLLITPLRLPGLNTVDWIPLAMAGTHQQSAWTGWLCWVSKCLLIWSIFIDLLLGVETLLLLLGQSFQLGSQDHWTIHSSPSSSTCPATAGFIHSCKENHVFGFTWRVIMLSVLKDTSHNQGFM